MMVWRAQAYSDITSRIRCIIEVDAVSAEAAREHLERHGWVVVRMLGRAK